MYLPSQFEETRPEQLSQLMHAHPLATLITLGADGLNANHIPFEFDPEPAPFGTLRAHIARSNPLWRDFSPEVEALVVFQGPQSYISPSWYATKKEHGKVVPTFNYMVVHAYGALRVIDDPVWMRGLLQRLTDRHEASRAQPWKVDDAPQAYIEQLMSAIIGLELPVSRLIGKWKVSQNQSQANRAGVAEGLTCIGDPNALAMAAAVCGHKDVY